jgi:hypothetical protein
LKTPQTISETVALTPTGEAFAVEFGIDLAALKRAKAPLCRSCLDWSERRTHLAGSLGRAMLTRMETLGWVRQDQSSRAIHVTPKGQVAFAKAFPQS